MASRRKAREFALQLLFQEDLAKTPPEEICQLFWNTHKADAETRRFSELLFRRYLDQPEMVDDLISRNARNWKLERMATVDRSILRMAVAEFLSGETPPVVVIDEAIEVARKYSTGDSTEFVNGVLDAVRQELERERPGAS